MTLRLAFPSDQAPGLPAISVDVPDGWIPITWAGAMLAARLEVPHGRFAPNLVVTMTRHGNDYPIDAAVAELDDALRSLTEAETLDAGKLFHAEASIRSRIVAFRDAESGTLVQVHVLVASPTAACVDLVHAVGTCAAGDVPGDLEVLCTAFESLTVSREPKN